MTETTKNKKIQVKNDRAGERCFSSALKYLTAAKYFFLQPFRLTIIYIRN